MYMINEISKLTGVSIRMLHHYDKIGLLKPNKRAESNYRMYNEDDIERLYQVLIFKELDFSLQDIKKILDDEEFDKEKALIVHRKIILEKKLRLERILSSIDDTIENLGGNVMNKDNLKAFNYEEINKYQDEYKKEIEDKYGKTSAYEESKNKTSKYSKEDWKDIMEEADSIYKDLADVMNEEPGSDDVQLQIERWRNHINTNYYNCTIEIFRGLAAMYVADERFKKNIDKYKVGLAEFMSNAMEIYCDRRM